MKNLTQLGREKLTIARIGTNRTRKNSGKDWEKRYEKTLSVRINCGQVRQTDRRGKSLILNLEIKGKGSPGRSSFMGPSSVTREIILGGPTFRNTLSPKSIVFRQVHPLPQG